MFQALNATGYDHNGEFYHAELEKILSKVVVSYSQTISDKTQLANDENSIRDHLLYSYLKNQNFKKKHEITDFLFDKELVENSGRIDIRVMPVNPFISDDAYYILECKRLNSKNTSGKTGLNGEYISEGICRFISQKYSCYHQTNGMIGFVVDKMDIDKNISSVNKLLTSEFPEAKVLTVLTKRILDDFGFAYCSTHRGSKCDLLLYHLMFDLAGNIRS